MSSITSRAVATPTTVGLITSYFSTIQSAINNVSSANYTITTTDGYEAIFVNTGGADRTITLPAASANTGRVIYFKKTNSGAGTVIITRAGSDTIDGATTLQLGAQYESTALLCDGTGWNRQAAPILTQSLSGLVTSAGQLLGTNTNDNASAGNVGEFMSAAGTATTVAGSTTVSNIATITLTKGDWDIWGVTEFSIGNTTLLKELDVLISSVGSSSSTGATATRDSFGVMYFPGGVASSVATEASPAVNVGPFRLSLSGNQQLWLNVIAVYTTSTTGQWTTGSIMQARRVR